jgi:methionyl-tRNA synthetase
MSKNKRQILVSSALPYANGALHIGHMLEYVQTDIWVRFQKLRGNDCLFVCASDAHGTPIMLAAEKEGITPEELVERVAESNRQDYADFHIEMDNFHSTHSDENRELVEGIYAALVKNGHIARKKIRQAFDEERNMFLPDRYVRGNCPRCGADDQYGDSCEVCGSTYSQSELVNPISVVSGKPPVEKESEHLFFKLADFESMLREWIHSGRLHSSIVNKLDEWFDAGLRDWDISRDAPYFGFEIPGEDNKFFYVWLDAPIGYMASFLQYCRARDIDFDSYWRPGGDTELYHFVGKDIIYFHALFWPAVLHGAGYRRPTAVLAHGFLTVNGTKMSKARGTFITARTYVNHLNAEYLRYYFAGKLGPGIDDLDLNLDDFRQRVNSDIVGKLVNIASRCAGFIQRMADGKLAAELPDPELFARFSDASESIAGAYENREYARAIREIMALADEANRFIDSNKPWVLAKEEGNEQKIQAICTQGLNHFRQLCIYLKPVLPELVSNAEEFLQSGELSWNDLQKPQLGSAINPFKPLALRIETTDIEKMLEASREELAPSTEHKEQDNMINIDEFKKMDLRVARITNAEMVDGADKLLRLTLDIGGETRQVFAGIKSAYQPEDLVDRLTIMVANLKPRKMRFGISEGMILAASDDQDGPYLLAPDSGARPGMKVS